MTIMCPAAMSAVERSARNERCEEATVPWRRQKAPPVVHKREALRGVLQSKRLRSLRPYRIDRPLQCLGVRELAHELQCSHGTAVNAFRELDDAGLAHPVTLGRYPGKRATEWRLTFKRCDATGELPILNWQARPEVTTESTKGQEGKRKPVIRSRGKAQTSKNPMSEFALRSPGEAHVYMKHMYIYSPVWVIS